MLMVNPDVSASQNYECFNADFYDQNADTKDILHSLNNSIPLLPLESNEHGSLDLVPFELTSGLTGLNGLSTGGGNPLNGSRYTDYIDGKFEGYISTNWSASLELSNTNSKPFTSPSTELANDLDSRYWESKSPDQWTSEDVWHWIFSWAGDRNIDVEEVQPLAYSNMTGSQLCQMSKSDFIAMNPKYGAHIYETLQQSINKLRSNSLSSNHLGTNVNQSDFSFFPNLPSFDLLRSSCFDLDCQGSSPSSGSESDRESTSSNLTAVNERQSGGPLLLNGSSGGLHHGSNGGGGNGNPVSNGCGTNNNNSNSTTTSNNTVSSLTLNHPLSSSQGINIKPMTTLNSAGLPLTVKKVGRRGRPPKKDAKSRNRQGKGNGKLWEFIRDLLLDPVTNPSLIRWEKREDGIFKFVQSDKVAKLWGQRKQNPRMTYEKLSRAMRYYYKSQVLLPVFGRRLVYKFGPNATGWRPHPINLM